MTKTIVIANQKGGVGKSTLTEVMSYILSKHNDKKVLVIDTDPQANVTDKLFRTFNKPYEDMPSADNRLMGAIDQTDLSKAIVQVTDKLDLIAGDWQLERFHDQIASVSKDKRYYILYTLLQDITPQYDYVLIDTRPSTDVLTSNVVCASDYVLIASKSEEDSFNSTIRYIEYLQRMIEYNEDLNLIGIVNYLVNMRGYVDNQILERFEDEFKNLMFDNKITSSEVVKRWGLNGITENKSYDKKILSMYTAVVNEMDQRIKELK